MCLIIHREAGKRISHVPEAVLDHNRYQNPDGFGIAWRDTNGLQHEKFGAGPEEYARFRDLVLTIDRTDFEYVAHFRKATHGPVCKELSHPFEYRDTRVGPVLVFHNGIISIKPDKGESDTSQFVKDVLSNMQSRWWKKPAYRFLVEQSVGWSRLLIMTRTETIRLNAKDWKQENGIYYSCSPMPAYASKGSYGSVPYSYGLGWADDDDNDEYDYMQGVGVKAKTKANGWSSQGHWVRAETEENDKDTQDRWGRAVCVNCKVVGEYYVIEGKEYIDVDHEFNYSKPQGKPTVEVAIDEKNKETIATVVERDRKLLTPGVIKSAKESAAILLPNDGAKPRRVRKARRVQVQLGA